MSLHCPRHLPDPTARRPAGFLPRAALLAAVVLALSGTDPTPASAAGESGAPSGAANALGVTIGVTEQQPWPVSLNASGSVAAWMEATIGARITGQPLNEVRVNVGDHVHKGQLLARFDDATLKTDLAVADANLQQAQAAAAQADANRERAERIRASGAISEQEVLQYQTAASSARAQVAQAAAQRASAQLRLDFADVLAPDDGIISARGATVGSVSQAAGSGAELFHLIRQGRLEWRAELPGAALSRVHAGQTVRLSLPDGSEVRGKVRQIAPGLDANTRLGLVYVDLAKAGSARPGMYLSGLIEFPPEPALVVPAESVVIRDGRSYVLRLQGNDHVRLQRVETGRRQGNRIEVVNGLHKGDSVVVQGAGFLNDGDTVRVLAAPQSPG